MPIAPFTAEYRRLRQGCARHTTSRFDALAEAIAHQLADGEDVTANHLEQAAQILASGQDHA